MPGNTTQKKEALCCERGSNRHATVTRMDRHSNGGLLMRLSIACPDALRSDANNLAMVLGYGPADAETYVALNWQDAGGNLYACASLTVSDTFTTAAQSPLQRPSWDTDNIIDMDAARRAQAALVFSLTPVTAMPDKLTACAGDDALATLAAMGLTQVEVDL